MALNNGWKGIIKITVSSAVDAPKKRLLSSRNPAQTKTHLNLNPMSASHRQLYRPLGNEAGRIANFS
jgi:hypothetical protein